MKYNVAMSVIAALVAFATAPAWAQSAAAIATVAETSAAVEAFVTGIETAHQTDAWYAQSGLIVDLKVEFGGRVSLNGTLKSAMHAGQTRIDRMYASTIICDGAETWVSSGSEPSPRDRFNALTWAYFLAAPHKLRDQGVRIEPLGDRELEGSTCHTARLTFDDGMGDTPDDWYLLYVDPATGRLAAMAYIVTFGKSVEEAEGEPHAIVYKDYRTFDGIPVSMEWEFRHWSEEEGVHGEPIGRVTLKDFEFAELAPAVFTPSDDWTLVPMPKE